ncbi:MAG: indolepyruvate ferredoxin oxidoreductase subunit beta [Promethearchaeota archaeon CR_4]|nr:MAG: indolepyruvate ferredoxin oxidoreductase subunit beta [Candidatus Lokiarchaeota archaeon CR_4]
MVKGDHKIFNCLLTGTAGQGVITIKRLIEFAAQEAGYEGCFGSEMHGLAQREGAISCHVRLQKVFSPNQRQNIQAPTICYGDTDLVLGFEPVEVLRGGVFLSEKTKFVINDRTIQPILVNAGKEEYPSLERIEETVRGYSKDYIFLPATQLAIEKLDDAQKMNLILLGVALGAGWIPHISFSHFEIVIKRELRDPALNLRALTFGINEAKTRISR